MRRTGSQACKAEGERRRLLHGHVEAGEEECNGVGLFEQGFADVGA